MRFLRPPLSIAMILLSCAWVFPFAWLSRWFKVPAFERATHAWLDLAERVWSPQRPSS